MTWVLWDIFIPLLTAFGLGTLFGFVMWRWRREMAVAETGVYGDTGTHADASDVAIGAAKDVTKDVISEDVIADASDEVVSDDETHAVNHSDKPAELESANIVLIQERDRAVSELDSLRTESELLKTRLKELEKDRTSDGAEHQQANGLSLNPAEETLAATRVKELENQLLELEQNLEQRTVAYNEECRAKRELELELLNSRNEYEKLEVKSQSGSVDDNGDSELQHEQSMERSRAMQSELESLEVNHAKLQAELEQQKRNTASAEGKVQVREKEIEELRASLDSGQSTTASPSISLEQSSGQSGSTAVQTLQSSSDAGAIDANDKAVLSTEKPNKTSQSNSLDNSQNSSQDSFKRNSTKSGYVPVAWSVPDSKPSKAERDELTNIKGVGPVLEKLLHQTGIYYFQQVADLDKKGIDELQQQIPQFPNRIRRDQWVRQAKKLHREKYGTAKAS